MQGAALCWSLLHAPSVLVGSTWAVSSSRGDRGILLVCPAVPRSSPSGDTWHLCRVKVCGPVTRESGLQPQARAELALSEQAGCHSGEGSTQPRRYIMSRQQDPVTWRVSGGFYPRLDGFSAASLAPLRRNACASCFCRSSRAATGRLSAGL